MATVTTRTIEEVCQMLLDRRGYLVMPSPVPLKSGDTSGPGLTGNDPFGPLDHILTVTGETDSNDYLAQVALVEEWGGHKLHPWPHYYRMAIE